MTRRKVGRTSGFREYAIDPVWRVAQSVPSSETRARRTSSEHRKVGAREARREAARRNGGKPRERCKAGSRKGSEPRKGSVTGVGRRIRLEMVRGASRWLPWSRRDRLGRGLSDTTPARCQRPIEDVAPRSTGGFGRTVTRGCVASGAHCVASGPLRSPFHPHDRVTAVRGSTPRCRERRQRDCSSGSSAGRPRAWPGVRRPPPGGSARPGPGRGRRGASRRCSGPGPGSTVNELVASDSATTSGSSTSASSEASDGGLHGGLQRLVEGRGEAPQVHGDPGVGRRARRAPGRRRPRSRPRASASPGAARPRRGACRRRPTRQMPRVTGEVPDHGVVEAVAHQRVGVGVLAWRCVTSWAQAAWP